MPEKQGVRVVIAEDDAAVGESIRGGLEEAGYRVVAWATDGVAAVERTIDLRPDVVLMDVQLPALSGIAAARRIAETYPTPIVILSAYDQPELVTLAVESGVGAYLTKPANARELDRALSIAIARFADLQNLRKLNETMKAQTECSKRQEKLNQTILNTAMDGYWLLDGTGRFVDVSDAYCRLLGYSREEVLNTRASDLAVDRGDKGSVSHVVDPMVAVTGRFEIRQRRKDGVLIDVEVNATPLPAEGRIFADLTPRNESRLRVRVGTFQPDRERGRRWQGSVSQPSRSSTS